MSKQSRWILTFIMMLVFGAIACQACAGRGDETGDQPDSESPAVDVDSVDPDDTAEEGGSTQAEDEAPGDASDGEEPPAEEDEDELAKETEEPVEVEPTLIPTAEPTQETGSGSQDETGSGGNEDETDDNGSEDQQPPSTSGGDANEEGVPDAGAPSDTACNHPYLPLVLGANWTYNNNGETLVWEVIDVQGDINNATAVLRINVGEFTLDSTWSCSAEEGISSFDFADYGFGNLGADMTIEQTSADGVFLPPADQLVPGATWDLNMENSINFSQDAGGETIVVTGDMTNIQRNEVVGTDPVDFDGQTVDGVQVDQVNSINLVLTMAGTPFEQDMAVTNSYNFGKGIGIINQISTTDFGTDSMLLVSFNIP